MFRDGLTFYGGECYSSLSLRRDGIQDDLRFHVMCQPKDEHGGEAMLLFMSGERALAGVRIAARFARGSDGWNTVEFTVWGSGPQARKMIDLLTHDRKLATGFGRIIDVAAELEAA